MGNSKIIKTILLLVSIVSIGCLNSRESPQLRAILSESEAINNAVTMGEVVYIFESDGGRGLSKPSSARLRIDYSPTSNKSTEDLFDELEMLLLNNNWTLSKRLKEDGTSLLFKKSINDEIFTGVLAIRTDDNQNNIVYIRLESKPFL